MFDLDDRVALVLGGGSEVGHAVALALGARGAAVAVGDLDAAGAARTVFALRRRGGVGVAIDLDAVERVGIARSSSQTLEALAQAEADLGHVSIVVLVEPEASGHAEATERTDREEDVPNRTPDLAGVAATLVGYLAGQPGALVVVSPAGGVGHAHSPSVAAHVAWNDAYLRALADREPKTVTFNQVSWTRGAHPGLVGAAVAYLTAPEGAALSAQHLRISPVG